MRLKTGLKILLETHGNEDLANPGDLFARSNSHGTHCKDKRQIAVAMGGGGLYYFRHYYSYRRWYSGLLAVCLIVMTFIATVSVRGAA
jgi:hypothetical protein